MYICNDCQEIFDAPGTQTERHYEVPYLRDEHFDVCPFCDSDNIEKAHKCSKCGEYKETHKVCANCGYYNGRQVISVEE